MLSKLRYFFWVQLGSQWKTKQFLWKDRPSWSPEFLQFRWPNRSPRTINVQLRKHAVDHVGALVCSQLMGYTRHWWMEIFCKSGHPMVCKVLHVQLSPLSLTRTRVVSRWQKIWYIVHWKIKTGKVPSFRVRSSHEKLRSYRLLKFEHKKFPNYGQRRGAETEQSAKLEDGPVSHGSRANRRIRTQANMIDIWNYQSNYE